MNNIERRDNEMAYISDDAVMEEQKKTRKILRRLNTMAPSDFDGIGKVVEELLGKSHKAFINPPFYCETFVKISINWHFMSLFSQ